MSDGILTLCGVAKLKITLIYFAVSIVVLALPARGC
jgi:hypothetical protein